MDSLNLGAALPELFLAAGAMALLMYGVFRQDRTAGERALWLSCGLLVFAMFLAFFGSGETDHAFMGAFVTDAFGRFAKVAIFGASAATLYLSYEYMKRIDALAFEFPVLVVFAALGMAMMASATDLISLYVGLELQSLSLYVLAAFRRDSARSTEAGLKYFVLGALSSGLLLFGASFVYGFTGSTRFEDIAAVVSAGDISTGLLVGMALMVAGLAFKISAAPFHMWTPDVYEGAPTPVVAFFATAPKAAAAALFVRLLYDGFGDAAADWGQILAVLAMVSVVVGAVGALAQTNIKRLMAFSSIGHMGFLLLGLAAGTVDGVQSTLIYMMIYIVMNIGVFAFILSMRKDGRQVTTLASLGGLSHTSPGAAFALAILIFSLAGIPPLGGFFAKLFVIKAAVDVGGILTIAAIVAVLGSVISAFYYLRLVKVMYFDESEGGFDPMKIEYGVALGLSAIVMAIFAAVGGFAIPDAALSAAQAVVG